MSADVPSKEAVRDLCYLYWSAYHAGHHDTVEGQYTDVLPVDRFDYHADVVAECLHSGDMPNIAPLRARIAELTSELEERDIRYAARELHTQGVVDENTTLRTAANQVVRALKALNETYNLPDSGTFGPEQPLWDAVTDALSTLRIAGVTGEESK